jgi:glucuronosyltransferase
MSAMDTSVYWVEYVGKYGNVLRSPALDLYWWQRNLLDVYAFVFGILAVGLYVVLFILCKIKKCLCGSRTCAKKDSAAMKSKKNK